jgi:Protein of unknown function (DUF5818)
MAMNTVQALLHKLSAVAVMVGLCLVCQSAIAQSSANQQNNPAAQQAPAQHPDDPNSAAEMKTFTGKIVKSGDKFVLADAENKTSYQLDDQQKAQEFLNRDVKVVGVLDAATGTIRVSAIEPV